MVYSMTGFGRAEASDDAYKITVEIKTVNNRYLDMNVRMPRSFGAFEAEVRALVKQFLRRGKADVFVGLETISARDLGVTYNAEIAGEYARCMRQMAQEFSLADDVAVSTLARLPDVFQIEDKRPDEDALRKLLIEATKNACLQLNEARAKEGAFLQQDLEEKIAGIRENVAFITSRAPEITKAYEARLKERITSLIEEKQVDEARLLTEVAIFADKSSVDEELVRLTSHIDAFLDTIHADAAEKEGVGRKLDFIIQEMNREANTTLSKSPDMEVSQHAVEIKTEIEKIREQIQNLE